MSETVTKTSKRVTWRIQVVDASAKDPLIEYFRQETPSGGFIFYNSKGFLREQMYDYEEFQALVRISNRLYREILLESITPSSVLFLKESVQKLEKEDA